MTKNHRIALIGLILTLAFCLSSCAHPTQSAPPAKDSIPPTTTTLSTLSTLSTQANQAMVNNTSTAARNIDDQLTYYYVPIRLYDQDDPAEILIDHYETAPQRHIYVLAPDREYHIEADYSAYDNRTTPSHTDVEVSYSHSLSDAEIGSIEVLITKTYADASQAVFYGEAKFVVDSPSGLNLRCIKPEIDNCDCPAACDAQIIFRTQAGELADATIPAHISWKCPRSHLHVNTYGHRYNVVDPATIDINPYFHPNTDPSTTPPAFCEQWLKSGWNPSPT